MTMLGSGTKRAAKRFGAGAAIGALLAGMGFTALPAMADAEDGNVEMDDVTFSWRMSDEAGGGAYFGGCNFFVAGVAGNTGASRVWNADDVAAFYKTEEGNVTITKPTATGDQVQPTWDNKCLGADGKAVTAFAGSTTNQQVNFANGTGTINPDTDSGTINWEGGYTVVFYGGMTYWSARDLELTVVNGTGELTATASGYGAAMDDPKKWVPLEEQRIQLATFKGVDLTDDGAVVTTDWAGVESNFAPEDKATAQNRTSANWGSFPQSFTKFQVKTGQSSYWYTSGGNSDPKKPSVPFTLGYQIVSLGDGSSDTDADIEVTIPEVTTPEPDPQTGAFSWDWSSKDVIDLGTATQDGANFVATGSLNNVVVSDTRQNVPGKRSWSVSGSVSDFTASDGDSFSAGYLGWTPKVLATDSPLMGGTVVDSTQLGGTGLGQSSVLANGAARNATLGANLKLVVPSTTKSGDYQSTLTITAIS